MKKTLFCAALLAAMVATGCSDEKKQLANEVEGTWASGPQILADADGIQSSIDETLVFTLDSTALGGDITIKGAITVSNVIPGYEQFANNVEATVAGSSEVKGTWKAIDDDEIMLTLNTAALQAEADTATLNITHMPIPGKDTFDPAPLRPAVAEMLSKGLKQQLLTRYSSWTKLDDVKVKEKGTVLNFEIGHRDYRYTLLP